MGRGERRLRGGVQTPLKYVFDFTLCSRGKSHLWCAEKQTRKNTKLQKSYLQGNTKKKMYLQEKLKKNNNFGL